MLYRLFLAFMCYVKTKCTLRACISSVVLALQMSG